MAGKTGRTQNAERRTPNAEVKAGEHPLVLFTSKDGAVSVPATVERETVWLTQAQMAVLFDKERSVITKHIRNAIREGEVDEQQVCANFAHTAPDGKTYQVAFYNLDVIISVGYRVKSQRGVEFRRWATTVLRDYMLKGYALNRQRLKVLGQVVTILKRAEKQLEQERGAADRRRTQAPRRPYVGRAHHPYRRVQARRARNHAQPRHDLPCGRRARRRTRARCHLNAELRTLNAQRRSSKTPCL